MKVLLINASVKRGLAYGLDDGMPAGLMDYLGGYQPLGVCYLAAVLAQHGYSEVAIIDAEAENLPVEEVAGRVETTRPDLIGISCVSFSFLYALDLARLLKQITRAPIVVGGPHVDIYPLEVLTHTCFDAGIVGEGETSFLELVRLFENAPADPGPALLKVPGAVCRIDGRAAMNPERPTIADLDALPYPARHLLPPGRYLQNYLPNPFISILTSRGCSYKCSYCCRPDWTRRVRFHSPGRVVDEIERAMAEFGASSFQFFDDTFTLNRKRALEICRLIGERSLKIKFLALSRVDRLDRELVAALAEAGCSCISFGVESGDERILAAMNKGFSPPDVGAAFDLCREHGIDIVAYYLLGHPEETHASVRSTIESIRRTRPDWLKANIMMPYPASTLYEELVADGSLPDLWRRMTLTGEPFNPPHICRHLSRRELERYRLRINLAPYFRKRTNLLNVRRLARPRNVLWSLQWLGQLLGAYAVSEGIAGLRELRALADRRRSARAPTATDDVRPGDRR